MSDDVAIKLAITENLYRYCRGLDRMDRELAESVWNPGATAEYGEAFRGPVDGLLDHIWANHALLVGHSHQITNVLIEIDGAHAVSEAYVTGYLWDRTVGGQLVHVVVVGRYLDRWSNRDERWGIEHRSFVDDARFVHLPVSSGAVALDARSSALGRLAASRDAVPSAARRGPTDPSYSLFARS